MVDRRSNVPLGDLEKARVLEARYLSFGDARRQSGWHGTAEPTWWNRAGG